MVMGINVKLMIFGTSSILGQAVVEQVKSANAYELICATRAEVDYTVLDSLHGYIKEQEPDMIINCAALSPAKTALPTMVLINSFFPHLLAAVVNEKAIPTIHVSSDAVFSGYGQYRYRPTAKKDPVTYYGQSRSLGEIVAPNFCIARCSYVGPESGIVRWLKSLESGASVNGWINYKWSGTTTQAVAAGILDIVKDFRCGVTHLAVDEPISKADVIRVLAAHMQIEINMEEVPHPVLNKALEPSPGYILPSLIDALSKENWNGHEKDSSAA